MILQVVVASQQGLDPLTVADVLTKGYRLPDGRRCRASLGHGEYLDGIPQNMIVLEPEEM